MGVKKNYKGKIYQKTQENNILMIQERLSKSETGIWYKLSKPYLMAIFVAVVLILSQNITRKDIDRNGVYTKCLITEVTSNKGGILVIFSYSIDNRNLEGLVPSAKIGRRDVNKQYFIKVLRSNPNALRMLSPVPDCLLNTIPPPEGWKELPKCQ